MEKFELEKECEREPEMISMRKLQESLLKKGRLASAAEIGSKIAKFKQQYMKDFPNGKYLRGNDLMKMMNPDEVNKFTVLVDSIAFCADIIHSSCIEVNELVGKVVPGARIEMMDDLAKLGKAASKQIFWMDSNVDEDFQNRFSEHADELTTLVLSYVKNKFIKNGEQKK